ncbi:MAG: hypothetical protein LBQ48_08335 [Oscillospiraceae bacterium]|jgi:hypothetical protein|nr:hypothetical protein [Oscillospiraceae bacterium]
MPEPLNYPLFFLGAYSARGYVSRFEDVTNGSEYETYILKGAGGTLCTALIQRAVNALSAAGVSAEIILAADDPSRLAGVLFPAVKLAVLDGSPPECLYPQYPGISGHLVDFGVCWQKENLLRNKGAILACYRERAELTGRAGRYLAAAGSLLSDSYRMGLEATDVRKAARFAANIARREFAPKNREGSESRRFISGITSGGHVFMNGTVRTLADRVYTIEDSQGAASRVIMAVLRALALENGYDIITCFCPISPDEKAEHIILPELSLAFCTSGPTLKADSTERGYHARRFTDLQKLRTHKQRLSFNKKASRELLQSAVDSLAAAKEVNARLEKHYLDATDFNRAEEITAGVIKEMANRI